MGVRARSVLSVCHSAGIGLKADVAASMPSNGTSPARTTERGRTVFLTITAKLRMDSSVMSL